VFHPGGLHRLQTEYKTENSQREHVDVEIRGWIRGKINWKERMGGCKSNGNGQVLMDWVKREWGSMHKQVCFEEPTIQCSFRTSVNGVSSPCLTESCAVNNRSRCWGRYRRVNGSLIFVWLRCSVSWIPIKIVTVSNWGLILEVVQAQIEGHREMARKRRAIGTRSH